MAPQYLPCLNGNIYLNTSKFRRCLCRSILFSTVIGKGISNFMDKSGTSFVFSSRDKRGKVATTRTEDGHK